MGDVIAFPLVEPEPVVKAPTVTPFTDFDEWYVEEVVPFMAEVEGMDQAADVEEFERAARTAYQRMSAWFAEHFDADHP